MLRALRSADYSLVKSVVLLMLLLCTQLLFCFSISDVQYWVGEGANRSVLVIDFNDSTEHPSLAWGYKWDGQANATQMLNAINESDPRLNIEASSGFLDNITFSDMSGLVINSGMGGDPDYWSTWSSNTNFTVWAMNSGVGSNLINGEAFGFSYGFSPQPTEPDTPIAVLPINNNSAPVANQDLYYLKAGLNQNLHVTFNDTDDQIINNRYTLTITSNPVHGIASVGLNNCIIYNTNNNQACYDSLTYTLTDSLGAVSNQASVFLNLFQGFSEGAESGDSIAVMTNDERISSWATHGTINRGYINIAKPDSGFASYGSLEDALGIAEGNSMDVVSLGDRGSVTLGFNETISNHEGIDFAVYENAFTDTSLELAFVEVSSDSVNFVRFPAVSITQNEIQLSNIDALNNREIHNLAGKYKQGFGTGFDLAELADSSLVDINNVHYIRIVDVVGSINPVYGTRDINNNIINDPYPTEFNSSGFDLDGIAILANPIKNNNPELFTKAGIKLYNAYPNPFNPSTTISFELPERTEISLNIYNVKGQLVKTLINDRLDKGIHSLTWNGDNNHHLKTANGVYFYRLESVNQVITKKMLVLK